MRVFPDGRRGGWLWMHRCIDAWISSGLVGLGGALIRPRPGTCHGARISLRCTRCSVAGPWPLATSSLSLSGPAILFNAAAPPSYARSAATSGPGPWPEPTSRQPRPRRLISWAPPRPRRRPRRRPRSSHASSAPPSPPGLTTTAVCVSAGSPNASVPAWSAPSGRGRIG